MSKRVRITKNYVIETDVSTVKLPRRVQWSDLIGACRWEDDTDMGMPWDEHDGWEHEFLRARDLPDDMPREDVENSEGWVWREGWREYGLIRLAPIERDEWKNNAFYHSAGMSKQTARERTAQVRREAVKQLARWYAAGRADWFYCVCEYYGERDSLGGILLADDDPRTDPYAREVEGELAGVVASALTERGFIIEGRPAAERQSAAERLHVRKLNAFADRSISSRSGKSRAWRKAERRLGRQVDGVTGRRFCEMGKGGAA